MSSAWQELGIEPTTDARAIRAAYARRLKDIDPERDPEAFQRLRQAYEAALASLRSGERRDAGTSIPPRAAAPAGVPVADSARNDDGGADPALDALDRALAERDATRALTLLDGAIAKGLVPLTPEAAFIDRLLDVVTADASLSADTFTRVIRSFGWDAYLDAVSKPPPPVVARAIARLSAAAWFARLRASASTGRAAGRSDERAAARLMLGGRRPLLLMDRPRRRLRAELEQFDRHAPFLAGRFDADRLRWLRWVVTEEAARREARKLLGFWIAVTALLIAAALLPGH